VAELEEDEAAEYLAPQKNARSKGKGSRSEDDVDKLKDQIEKAQASVEAMEMQLEDAREQETLMPGVGQSKKEHDPFAYFALLS
jgi:uncharacterized protein involved in exopolysaccharide biosynthesis